MSNVTRRCGHCKNLAPAWGKAATALKGKFKIAAIDCTAHTATCSVCFSGHTPVIGLDLHDNHDQPTGPSSNKPMDCLRDRHPQGKRYTPAASQEFGVNGYPTIKFFGSDKEKPEDYSGGRSEDDIVAFATTKWQDQLPPPEVRRRIVLPSDFLACLLSTGCCAGEHGQRLHYGCCWFC